MSLHGRVALSPRDWSSRCSCCSPVSPSTGLSTAARGPPTKSACSGRSTCCSAPPTWTSRGGWWCRTRCPRRASIARARGCMARSGTSRARRCGVRPPRSACRCRHRRCCGPGERRFERRENVAGAPYFIESHGVSWAVDNTPRSYTFSVAEDLQEFTGEIDHCGRASPRGSWAWRCCCSRCSRSACAGDCGRCAR